ncbi:hypothetical protein EPR50_G00239060 [Perca flavescens]|uniref:Uncharacterized protein n=1 Tax=Perca flavescens TaxID=8167 RepID=A0A484C5T7_PERFV|nr:uncharacterized protein LOC114551149 [Perca flavescens]TDG96333.1 hypothetical protein EPR50_G00239060 [Perca flavescens]
MSGVSNAHLVLTGSRLSWSFIPSGRQLPRTPPLPNVTKHLTFCDEDLNEDTEPQLKMEADTRDQDGNNQNATFAFNKTGTKKENLSEPCDPNSMLKGMKGYLLTPSDLEFIEKMEKDKLVKKLQQDLEKVQRLLQNEMMSLELVCASRVQAQAVLENLPSCEDLTEWVKVALNMTSPSTDLTNLDSKSLLAMVTKENLQGVADKKGLELTRMKKMLANKKKKEAQERGQLEKQIASERLKIQGLMSQLSDLKSELSQQKEAYKDLELQIKTKDSPEIKAEEADTSEELQAAKRRGKGTTQAVKSTENLQGTKKQSRSTRSKPTDGKMDSRTSVEDDRADKNTSETLKTKRTPGAAAEEPTKSVKEARGPQKNGEKRESNSQESVGGRRKPARPARTTASRVKNQSHVKTGESHSTSQQAAPSQGRKQAAVAAGDAAEEARNTVLRRSKRIASRR